jgi:CRISPR-associated endonuclease/helicase Cas3
MNAYWLYWGKARPDKGGSAAFHLLPYHCLDVAAVGAAYLRRSGAVRSFLMERLGVIDEDALLRWVTFWLALHDLGKFSEAFQSQRPDVFFSLRGRMPAADKAYIERHDSLGMKFWSYSLCPHAISRGWFGPDAEEYEDGLAYWARAVTGHHGQPPKDSLPSLSRFFDMREDKPAIHAFADDVRTLFLNEDAARLPSAVSAEDFRNASVELSWWLAGLAVLADWMGSNADIFTYRAEPDMSMADYWPEAQAKAARALGESGVLPAARQKELGFNTLFPGIAEPSPLQTWAASVEIGAEPQIHLLEDVTGAGKTEAAVALAHRMMAAGAADGFFIGLPTMATANAMYERIAEVYARLFADQASLVLAHGRKNLVEHFAASVVMSGVQEADWRQQDDTATARCTAWLADHNKRALLAPAGIGTIDQALLAALQSRHQSLRLLGLFRKVLVVDEVHACDAYMQGVLEVLLRFHARAGGSAILLSATLPERMKSALLKAFADGCWQRAPALDSSAYPLVTSWSAAQPQVLKQTAISTRLDVRRRVAVHYESDRAAVIRAIITALAAGQCVAWIRNTITDAVEARAELARLVPLEQIHLFHARFALADRLAIETHVLDTFGPNSGPDQRSGMLLIATQVAEQSLDVDFDLVISDLAPIDRLIQRAGRLRRHVRDARGTRLRKTGAQDERGEPCLWVFGPDWVAAPPANWFKQSFPKAANVYPHHGQLWLSAGALQIGHIDMPDDARELIEGVFGDGIEVPDGLRGNANQAEGKAYGDASLAQLNSVKLECGYMRGGIEWMSEGVTPSRLGEDTGEVLLARWEGDALRPWCEHAIERHAWAYSSVRVARRLIATATPPVGVARQAALDALNERLPGRGKWVVVLAFEGERGQFRSTAQGLGRAGQPAVETVWHYDARTGLQLGQTPNMEDQ